MGSCWSSDSPSSTATAAAAEGKNRRSKKSRSGSRPGSRSGSPETEALRSVPGRMYLNGSSAAASMFSQQGKKGTNQDAMIVWENFCTRNETVFCGVFDGHGPFGHMVSRRVRDILPLRLKYQLENDNCEESNGLRTAGSMNSEESLSLNLEEESSASIGFEEKENHSEPFAAFKQFFLKAFKVTDKELRSHPNIDCFCSGTTAVTLVKQGQDLVIGNVGDSRAVLGTRDEDDCLTAVQLTVDLKPNLPREEERIRRCKGRVFALRDEPKVSRVWLPKNDSPGLAMARAFGDFCLKDFGLISVPDISYRRISERDEFIVLATDGVWDVLSNEEVVKITASAPLRSYAARSLVEAAVKSWKIKYPTSKVDDCAAVCLFLDSEETSNSISSSSTNEICNGGSLHSTEAANDTELYSSTQTPLDRACTFRSSTTHEKENQEIHTLNPTSLDRSGTGQSSEAHPKVSQEEEVEGVARADTLLKVPRFVSDTKVREFV